MNLLRIFTLLASAFPLLVSGVTVPGADTPLFYLIANGPSSTGVNFLPVRLNGGTSTNYFSILTGTGPIAKFYFFQGALIAYETITNPPSTPWRAFINTQQTASSTCAPYGAFGTVYAVSSNKCASYNTFGIQSNSENAQLGGRLVFNWTGGFYLCGDLKEVHYKTDPAQPPQDCVPIELSTVPVIE